MDQLSKTATPAQMKQDAEIVFDKKNENSVNQARRLKRKAPDIPTNSNAKLSHSNGTAGTSLHLPISQQLPPHTSSESLTSSSATSDYSPSSRSFTFSSLSESVETLNHPQNQSIKSVSDPSGDCLQHVNNIVQPAKNGSSTDTKEARINAEPNRSQHSIEILAFKPGNCANLGDYVEQALLVSSSTSLLSSSPNKSAENLSNIAIAHHPPRLTSFESSSTLHHEGLVKVAPVAPVEPGLKPHYVTLDFVKTAAAAGDRSGPDNPTGSSSSLSSSFMSSIDSEVNSTIGSDVVESLYNKITAASAKYETKNSPVKSPDVETGDIEKDLFPFLFPGHRRQNVSATDAKQDTSSDNLYTADLPNFTSVATTSSKDFPLQNSSQSDNSHLTNSSQVNEKHEVNEVKTLEISTKRCGDLSCLNQANGPQRCEVCGGVIINLNETIDEEMNRAKEQYGRCDCGKDQEFEAITEMDYSSCNLKEMPVEIPDYSESLLNLSLESNTITELPSELFRCSLLETLSVSDNDIASLPPRLAVLVNLKFLDVSKNVIEDIPDSISCCRCLEVLDASVNPIEKLSDGFTKLISLRELYMNDCFFDFLPASFGRMSQLKVLELRDNQLQNLPKSMRRLSQLSRLDLGGNAIELWPDVISQLTNLCELWLDCNELGKVPSELGNLTQLTYLDLSRNFLEFIPSQIGSLDHLTDLLLAENALTTLPDSIGFLYRLNVLNLELNQIQELPDCFGKLRSLEEVDLSHNRLEFLPSTVGRLRKLHTLLLDDNKLTEIPDELGRCGQLNIVQVSRNQIGEVPDSMGNLSNLRVLNICQNRVSHLPITLIRLEKLEALWISPNQSKPNVPLEVEIDPESGRRILTNVLFPQEANGPSRVVRLLGIADENDHDAYANDAADDDDLEAYVRRERGKTQVVFNLDATSYSDDMIQESDGVKEQHHMDIESSREVNVDYDSEERADRNVTEIVEIPDLLNATEAADFAGKESFDDNPPKREADVEIEQVDVSIPSKPLASLSHNFEPDVSKEIVLEVRSDDEYDLPSAGNGLRTWSSRSHLPSALTEQTDEWDPDKDISTEIKISENSISNSFQKPLENDVQVSIHQPMIDKKCTESLEFSNLKEFSVDKTANFDLDVVAFLGGKNEKSQQEKNHSFQTDKALLAKPCNNTSKIQCNVANAQQTNNPSLSRSSISEEKPLSVTSSESAPATDLDSGFGNDVESQGSVTDIQEDTMAQISENVSNYQAADKVISHQPDVPSVRRNKAGWIALVRTENKPELNENSKDLVEKSLRDSSLSVNKSLSSIKNQVSSVQSRYVPASTVDSTKVTYSHEYNKSRLRDQNRFASKANKVADSIRKFESFCENPIPTTNYGVKPKQALVQKPHTGIALIPATNTSSNKPMAIATILSSVTRASNDKEFDIKHNNYIADNRQTRNDPKNITGVESSVNFYTKPCDAHISLSPRSYGVSCEQHVYNVVEHRPMGQDEIPTPRHVRKSKFEEALAATKHKHFREKLEKIMQQQNNIQSDPSKRLSRNSSSSLTSLPRITSPVPHQHHHQQQPSCTPFEQMTAENTSQSEKPASRAQKSASIHSRLKEKLQPLSGTSQQPHAAVKDNTALSRDRPGSARHASIACRSSTQRSSLRSRPTEEAVDSNTVPKKSLEEQLGQLLLDANDKSAGRYPASPQENQTRVPVDHKRLSSTDRPTRPADWKLQLLQYLERKKLSTGGYTLANASGRPDILDPKMKSQTFSSYSNSIYPLDHFVTEHQLTQYDGRLNQQPQSSRASEATTTSKTEKRKSLSKVSSAGNFVRTGSAKPAGRRSSGRNHRTRTPGPETSVESRQAEVVIRPRSAMDMPSSAFEQIDPGITSKVERKQKHDKKGNSLKPVVGAPPSYEDHLLRCGKAAVTSNQQNYHDYVNVDYVNQMRSKTNSSRQYHSQAPTIGFPLRSTGSHDSVLNAKYEKSQQRELDFTSKMKGSASHNSIIDNRNQPLVKYRESYAERSRGNYPSREHYPRNKGSGKEFGEIPSPPKTVKKSSSKSLQSFEQRDQTGREWDSREKSYHAYLPSHANRYEKSPPVISTALQCGYADREDKSVVSAFRPYHQRSSIRPHKHPINDGFHDYRPQHRERGNLHKYDAYYRHPPDYCPNANYHKEYDEYSRYRPSNYGDGPSMYRRDTDVGVELVTVTVRKNPTFGFHIMGGVDAGGNPYRHDDDGVFITYVTPGGSADQLVKAGDKILLVNGSDFVGITHRRAVDLLRNAGHVAVLVVERLAGRAV